MSMSKLNIQTKVVAVDSKVTSERRYKFDEIRSMETNDEKIRQFLKSACCDSEQTAQFFHYLASEACTSVCKTRDIPSQEEWGGWFQSEFLVLYTRSLFETHYRITQLQDGISHGGFNFAQELEIAKQCFQSAQERNDLESAKNKISMSTSLCRDVTYKKNLLMASSLAIGNQHREKISQLQRNQRNIVFCQIARDASQDTIDQFKDEHDGLKLSKYKQNKLKMMRMDLAKHQHSLNAFSEQNKDILSSLTSLDLQYAEKQDAIRQKDAQLLKNQQDQIDAEMAFRNAQNSCIQSLITRVKNLKPGENYCHAAGFKGHAIYINFENMDGMIQAKIFNLGAGLQNHHVIQSQVPLYLPVVINFNLDKLGKENLNGFCQSITKAITENENEATRLIYQSGYGKKLTEKEHNEYYLAGKITAELKQITGNCTAKGYFQALRERTKDDKVYANLMFSLFAWSKNLYFLRKQQTPLGNVLITANDLTHLRNSEAVFKDKNESWFKAMVNQLRLTALAPTHLVPTAAAKPPLLAGYSNYHFADSQVNKASISDDELFFRLYYK